MPIQCVENEYCKLEVHYIADPNFVESKRDEAVAQLKSATLPGFRPGKAPIWAIKLRMKDKIEEWMKKELVANAYDEILFETKIKTIGYPQVNKLELNNSNFWCDLTILKKPEFELKQYKGFEIPKPHQPHDTTSMVEMMIQELRVQHGSSLPYGENDFVQQGDKITLDFKCMMGEQKVEDLSREGFLYTVGENFIPEFDDNIMGMRPGEERVFDVKLSSNVSEEIKDKVLTFTVKVHMGMRQIPADLNDELAQKVGFTDYKSLREHAAGVATYKITNQQKSMISQQVIKKVLEQHDFKIPAWLLNLEAQQLAVKYNANWQQLNQEQKEMLLAQAENNCKLALIMDSIREQEPEAVISDDELLNVIRNKVSEMGQDVDTFLVEAQKSGQLLGIMSGLRNEIMVQWLVEQSKVIEE